jgi:hypothetical protein
MSESESHDERLIGGIFPPDPVIEYYKKDLDRTLYRENLKLTVTERFEKAMALQRFAEELRRAGKDAGLHKR